MQTTVRVILVFFLGTLILLNYNSVRLLSLALDSLNNDLKQRTATLAVEASDDLNNLFKKEGTVPDSAVRAVMSYHGIDGVVVYDPQTFRPQRSLPQELPHDALTSVRPEPAYFSPNHAFRWRDQLLVPTGFSRPFAERFYVLVFNVRKIASIERSTRLISYSNFLLIGLAALLMFYFLESTMRPYRQLMQTAKAAQSQVPETQHRSEAEFLIGTFKGVISKLKEKELELEKLHRSEKARADDVQQLNQDLIRSVSSGLMIIDLSKRISVFNEAAETILRVPGSAVLREPYEQVMKIISPDFKVDIDRCFEEKSYINRAEMEIHTEDGVRYLGAGITPLKDRQQNFAGVACLFSDITEFKQLQQQMVLKEKFASLGEMAAGVAHEFRNSIATISGYLQLLEKKLGPDQLTYAQSISKEMEALLVVVNDFLSFARPVRLQLTRFSLADLIQESLEEVRVSPPFVSISFSMKGTYPEISGDEAMLRQVFVNLLRNAAESIDGTGRNGAVAVSGSQPAAGKFVVVEIADNGVGIPEGDLSRIFTPFYTTKQKGVGLGLAIVQKLVIQHNGLISVESTPEGSVFRVHLPGQ